MNKEKLRMNWQKKKKALPMKNTKKSLFVVSVRK